MAADPTLKTVPLPASWPEFVKSAIVHVISLAHLAIIHTRSWAANSSNARVRLRAKLERARQEIGLLLGEELRIKDARIERLDPHRRPHYSATDRLAILELRAARGWSTTQTARSFLVQSATIASWMKRIDEGGKRALIRTCEPVNRFPDSASIFGRRRRRSRRRCSRRPTPCSSVVCLRGRGG